MVWIIPLPKNTNVSIFDYLIAYWDLINKMLLLLCVNEGGLEILFKKMHLGKNQIFYLQKIRKRERKIRRTVIDILAFFLHKQNSIIH